MITLTTTLENSEIAEALEAAPHALAEVLECLAESLEHETLLQVVGALIEPSKVYALLEELQATISDPTPLIQEHKK